MKNEVQGLMREILQDDFLELVVDSYRLEEDFKEGHCFIYLSVENVTTGEILTIEGTGVGLVDAAFQGLKARLSRQYPSLESIAFSAFELKGLLDADGSADSSAEARVVLGVRNSYGKEFTFEYQSRSVGEACIQATLDAVEYFVNSERTFVRLYKARKHYEKENRTDLVDKYTTLMARMVNNTSYSEVIDRIKSEM